MAAPLKRSLVPGDGPAAMRELGLRLLACAELEFAVIERPLARLAAERCRLNLARCCERLFAAAHVAPRESSVLLEGAAHALLFARAELEWVHAQGAMLPPAYRSLLGGLEVLRRRIDEGRQPRSD